MDFGSVLAEFDDPVTVQGSFNITAEYLGSGLVMVADMEVAEGTDDGTDIAEDEDTATDDDSSDEEQPTWNCPKASRSPMSKGLKAIPKKPPSMKSQ